MANHDEVPQVRLNERERALINAVIGRGHTPEMVATITGLPLEVIREVITVPTNTTTTAQRGVLGYQSQRIREVKAANPSWSYGAIARLVGKEMGKTIAPQTVRAALVGNGSTTPQQRQENMERTQMDDHKLQLAKIALTLPSFAAASKRAKAIHLYELFDLRGSQIAKLLGIRDQMVSNYTKESRERRIANGGVVVCRVCGRPLHSVEHKAAGVGPRCAIQEMLDRIDTRVRRG